jgi:Ca2+/Na+ antiporter
MYMLQRINQEVQYTRSLPLYYLTFQSLLVTACNKLNILTIYALSTLYLCVLYLSETNSEFCHLHKLIGFYNRDEKCLQRGTDWVFK